MKRNEIIEKLIKEGFSEKTLVNFTDKQLNLLADRMLNEEDVMISKKDPQLQQKIVTAKKQNKTIETYEEKKPSSGLSKEKKSEIVKKAKKGEDIGKKGKGFKKIVSKAKKSGAKDPEAVAASAMWKNVKREQKETQNWVEKLVENKYHTLTTKNEIMELITSKLNEQETMVPMPKTKAKKGHNGIPEFMSYDSITASEPSTKPSPGTKPSPTIAPGKPQERPKPKTPYQPGPGTNPKPKALNEKKQK